MVKIFELAFPREVAPLPLSALRLVFRSPLTHTQRQKGRQSLRGERQLSLSRFLSGMMGLRHRDTVTGGTTYGWCTVYRATVPPAGVPGLHQRDPRRVSAAGPALRGHIPRLDGGVADGWATADGTPVWCSPASTLK